jgi:hypothetical protein
MKILSEDQRQSFTQLVHRGTYIFNGLQMRDQRQCSHCEARFIPAHVQYGRLMLCLPCVQAVLAQIADSSPIACVEQCSNVNQSEMEEFRPTSLLLPEHDMFIRNRSQISPL